MIGRSSLLAQVVGRVSWRDFGAAVRRHGAERESGDIINTVRHSDCLGGGEWGTIFFILIR